MSLLLLLTLAGLVLLFLGAEQVVRGATGISLTLGLSPLVVGLTIVAFGTSAPELVIGIRAALADAGGVAIGGVVGSNIANVGLILGVAVMLRPFRVNPEVVRSDIPLLIGASFLGSAFLLDGVLGRLEGALLLAGLLLYVAHKVHASRLGREEAPRVASRMDHDASLSGSTLRALIGLALLAAGAESLLRGATGIADHAGIPATLIGLTVVAVGTSLPELATSAVAAIRGHGDLAMGNVVGSGLFNVLGILGISGLVRPLFAPGLAPGDLAVMVAVAVILLPFAFSQRRLTRPEGGVLLFLYAAYVIYLAIR